MKLLAANWPLHASLKHDASTFEAQSSWVNPVFQFDNGGSVMWGECSFLRTSDTDERNVDERTPKQRA
jgi:hypothetical protein